MNYLTPTKASAHSAYRESTQSWRKLLLDVKHRGLSQAAKPCVGALLNLAHSTALRTCFGGWADERIANSPRSGSAMEPKESSSTTFDNSSPEFVNTLFERRLIDCLISLDVKHIGQR
jgi:hypothetical protein